MGEEEAPKDKSDDINEDVADDSDKVENKEDTNNAKNVDDVKEETVAENDDNIAEKDDESETVETTKRMLSSEEIASKLKASLLNFFEKHNPEKANDESVNPLVTKYSDKGVDALQKLAGKFEKKYGDSLLGNVSAEEYCSS